MKLLDHSNFERFNLKLWLMMLGLCLVVYSTSMLGPFILDDAHTVQTNDAIKNPANFLALWTSARYYSSSPDNWGYRPLQALYNWTSWQMGRGWTLPFHLLKVLFFSFTVMFFILMWRELLPKAPDKLIFLGGLFFLLNPVHTQVVSYIAATSTLLAGMFVSLSLWQYLVYRRTGQTWRLLISGLAFFLSMLSKEEGIVLLGLLPLIQLYKGHQEGSLRPKARDFLVWAFYILIGAVALGLIISMFEPTSDLARGSMDRWTYFASQFRAYLRYQVMYFIPYDLNADNLQFGFAEKLTEPTVIITLAINVLLIGLSLFWARRQPLVLFCVLWFYCAISPSSSVVVLAEPVNDHRAFIAYLGFAGLSFLALDRLLKSGIWGQRLIAVVLVMAAGWTLTRNYDWSSNVNLWEDTIKKNPGSVRAHNNAALNYMHRAEWKRAAEILDACLVIEPRYAYCLINRALVGVSLGQEELAQQLFARAIVADFAGVNARRYYAEYMFSRGILTPAIPIAEEADRAAQGKNLFVRTLLIRLQLNTGNREKARAIWQDSFETFGSDPNLMSLKASL